MIAQACIVTTKRTEHILTINSDQSWYTCPPLQNNRIALAADTSTMTMMKMMTIAAMNMYKINYRTTRSM
jgi:phosphatidylserine decarboxylase